jgi:hypothetical protein
MVGTSLLASPSSSSLSQSDYTSPTIMLSLSLSLSPSFISWARFLCISSSLSQTRSVISQVCVCVWDKEKGKREREYKERKGKKRTREGVVRKKKKGRVCCYTKGLQPLCFNCTWGRKYLPQSNPQPHTWLWIRPSFGIILILTSILFTLQLCPILFYSFLVVNCNLTHNI